MSKKIANIVMKVLPHITIILCVMFITLWILDIYNPLMNFLNSTLSKVLMLMLFIIAILTSILTVALQRKSYKEDE